MVYESEMGIMAIRHPRNSSSRNVCIAEYSDAVAGTACGLSGTEKDNSNVFAGVVLVDWSPSRVRFNLINFLSWAALARTPVVLRTIVSFVVTMRLRNGNDKDIEAKTLR